MAGLALPHLSTSPSQHDQMTETVSLILSPA